MLTKRQEAFCIAYAKSGNATQAAIEAGYSEKTARNIGAENLTKPYIIDKLQELADEVKEVKKEEHTKKILTAAEMQEMLSQMANGEMYEEVITRDGIQLKQISIKDRQGAIDKLARMQGLFVDKVQVNGNINNPFEGLTTEELKKLAGE